ncbi:hypothetical protein [Falsiroseomonas selenitidurans]|uniref:Uncharacterized protein n=1 Tax=Falsiroseomonas selenitidurans TaxID=2716335 RepID=A0ABX1E9D4_9PROT|nr:hypothetical protein [Falsiroseomonas selenitidurans]NKC33486.1 hypothetical protein [Falsiroseomonas selenitidurans]
MQIILAVSMLGAIGALAVLLRASRQLDGFIVVVMVVGVLTMLLIVVDEVRKLVA